MERRRAEAAAKGYADYRKKLEKKYGWEAGKYRITVPEGKEAIEREGREPKRGSRMSAGGGGSDRERGGGGRRRRARATTTSEAAAAAGAVAQARGRRQVSAAEDGLRRGGRARAGGARFVPAAARVPGGAGPGEGRDARRLRGGCAGRARSGEAGARTRPLSARRGGRRDCQSWLGAAGGRVSSPERTRAGPGRGVRAVGRWPFSERARPSGPGPGLRAGWPPPP